MEIQSTVSRLRLEVSRGHRDGEVYVALVPKTGHQLGGLYRLEDLRTALAEVEATWSRS